VRSATGHLVETVPTALGEVHAVLVSPADGAQLEAHDLNPSQLRSWGAALARLHHGSDNTGIALPTAFTELTGGVFGGDAPLAAAVARLTDRLADLPRDPARFGTVHGDFEPDNLVWRGDAVTAFDFDEAARSWFVADIAAAVRNLDEGSPAFAEFVAGYPQLGPLDEADLRHLPPFTALRAATDLVRLPSVLDAGTAPGDPDWLVALHGHVERHLRRQRATVLLP